MTMMEKLYPSRNWKAVWRLQRLLAKNELLINLANENEMAGCAIICVGFSES